MTYEQALSYIHQTDWKGSRLGLDRIRDLLARLSNPERDLKFIHVAGTNGKGSVSVMLTSILSAAGYRTGLFTSPFLVEFRERIRIGDALISEEELVSAVSAVQSAADAMEDSPTEFELMTAIAFWYFREKKCDLVVCEVGLGGELDSTNVIPCPLLSVITTIGLDHTRELGNTIEDVARAKAGIVKRGAPVLFCERQNARASGVIRTRAQALSSPYETVDERALCVEETSLFGTRFSFGEFRDLFLPLVGAYQPKNAASVLRAVELLREGLSIPERAVREGLLNVRWQGRFEVLCKDPVVILDGAHNPHGAAALLESLDACFPKDTQFLALSAVMADKEYPALFDTVKGRLKKVFCVSPEGHARALDAKKLAAFCGESGLSAVSFDTVDEGARTAFAEAKETGAPLLVFGSLYLYKEASETLKQLV